MHDLVFLGSYAEPDSAGIYVCSFDSKTGALTVADEAGGVKNPSFLDLDCVNKKLYAIAEGSDEKGGRTGEAVSYLIGAGAAALTFLNKEAAIPASTCHITLDRDRRYIMVSSYHGGMIGLLPLLENGEIGKTAEVHQHSGSSVLPVQSQPRPHSITMDKLNRFAMACDLGLDRIKIYKLADGDADGRRLIYHGEAAVEPGAGPRHFVFHPASPYAYVINELNSTITAFTYDQEQGRLAEIQTVSALPEGFSEPNACADIHISPDGLFLYGSNRGHDSIAVFAIDPSNGKLSPVEHVFTGGKHPRNFALSPDGSYLLAANMQSDNIVTFIRDAKTGKLQPNGQILRVSKPTCIKFFTAAEE